MLSLDFFKAYDRVFLGYLLKVMKKMNFGDTFCKWIQMMHDGARTRFILEDLTDTIEVSFSIRQGDPLAMLLYVIYAEPLLLLLESSLKGLMFSSPQSLVQTEYFRQVSEAFCDDVNLLVTHDEDFNAIEKAVTEFEKASGAILSRNMKCQVLGLGFWKNRQNWSLNFLRQVKEVKIFGIWFMDNYKHMLTANWNEMIGKLRNTVYSWRGRYFANLKQRIEI